MAGQDFARIASPSEERPRGGGGWMPVVAGLAIGLVAGLAAGVALGGARQNGATAELARWKAEAKRLAATIERKDDEIQALKKEIERLSRPDARVGALTFYHELPAEPVTPAPLPGDASGPAPEAPAQKTASPRAGDMLAGVIEREMKRGSANAAGGPVFWVQAASFRARGDAERLLRKLEQHGWHGAIRVADAPSGGRWHRVMLGPWSRIAEARAAKQRLRDATRLDGLVLKEARRR